jgi:prepilin-type N-terminal cleavage/methylation domain-containing protein
MQSQRPSESGFTLIEALIAMVILAVGLMGISQLFYVATGSNQMANKGTATATQATEAMERLKAIPFPALVAGGDTVGAFPACAAACQQDDDPPGLTDCITTAGVYDMCRDVPGLGAVTTRWSITLAKQGIDAAGAAAPSAYVIVVQSRILGPLGGQLTQSEFRTMRSCTTSGCPLF